MDLGSLKLVVKEGAVTLEVHAKPRAKKSRIVGVHAGALDVAIAAPPVDGAANAELLETLVRALGISRRDVTLLRGESARMKLVEVRGLSEPELRARLARSASVSP